MNHEFTRECLALVDEWAQVVTALIQAMGERGTLPRSITLDNGSEFPGRVMEVWAIE